MKGFAAVRSLLLPLEGFGARGLTGGTLAYRFLQRRYPGAHVLAASEDSNYARAGVSKLQRLFGPNAIEELRGKVVLDFGCGRGKNAVELALNGCSVIGLDIQERFLQVARSRAQAAGVADRCRFVLNWDEPVDVILSVDAFGHFQEPHGILKSMLALVKEDGYVLVEFGSPWYHPNGGHLFSVFPWAHLIFIESALIRWRSDFKDDGATRFHEVAGESESDEPSTLGTAGFGKRLFVPDVRACSDPISAALSLLPHPGTADLVHTRASDPRCRRPPLRGDGAEPGGRDLLQVRSSLSSSASGSESSTLAETTGSVLQ